MAAQPDALLTAAEYGLLPEVLGFRDELIEGERVLSPSPQLPHTVVIKNIEAILTEQMQGAEVLRESGWYCRIEGLERAEPRPHGGEV